MARLPRKHNFSLIELLTAFTVIIILMGIAIGTYSFVTEKTKRSKTKALIKKLELSMYAYQHDTGYFFQQPTAGPLIISPDNYDFIKHIDYSRMKNTGQINDSDQVLDAWGNTIIYQCPGTNNTTSFDLISYGKNGTTDSGSNDDITNFTKN